jgi:predicted dehydrogenase
MTVRVAVLGLAGMGRSHVLAAQHVEGYELVALCDVNPTYLAKSARDDETLERFEDPDEFFASGLCDAVIIATPNWLHIEHVAKALRAGLHVYCEKPLGVTVGECRQLAEIANECDRRVQVGFQHRFQHHYETAHDLIASGELGPLYRADLYATNWFRPHVYFSLREWRGRFGQAGGGVLMMQAIHQLDAYSWICGMPSRVTAQAWRTRPTSDVEDEAAALLEFPSGARGVAIASTVNPTGRARMEFHGDNGSILINDDRIRRGAIEGTVTSALEGSTDPFAFIPVEKTTLEPDESAATTFDECVVACHRDFIEAIGSGREPRNTPDEATKSVELANAIYMSAALREPVDLPLDAAAYAETYERLSSGDLVLPRVS